MALCACGCGDDAGVYQSTRPERNVVAGTPRRFVHGHAARRAGIASRYTPKSPVEYIEEDRGYTTPCWIWQRAISDTGYGSLRRNGKTTNAHRVYHEKRHGAIPAGLQIDHLCRVRACVNPDHLEVVTNAVNGRRGNGAKLTEALVAEARRLRREEGLSYPELGRCFGVHHVTIMRAVKGELWA